MGVGGSFSPNAARVIRLRPARDIWISSGVRGRAAQLRKNPGFGRLDSFGIPWILSSETSLFKDLRATPAGFLFRAPFSFKKRSTPLFCRPRESGDPNALSSPRPLSRGRRGTELVAFDLKSKPSPESCDCIRFVRGRLIVVKAPSGDCVRPRLRSAAAGGPDRPDYGDVEVRSILDSSRIARVIFCMGDGAMILLHGFI